MHSPTASVLTITLAFQLALCKMHSYEYLPLILTCSPRIACIEMTCTTILAINFTLKRWIPHLNWFKKISIISRKFFKRFSVILITPSDVSHTKPNHSRHWTGCQLHFSCAIENPNPIWLHYLMPKNLQDSPPNPSSKYIMILRHLPLQCLTTSFTTLLKT